MEAFFRGSHTTNFVTCGFNRSYNQAAQVASSKVACKSPRSPSINCRMMLAFVSTRHSSTILPGRIHDRDGDAFRVDIHADILRVVHRREQFGDSDSAKERQTEEL